MLKQWFTAYSWFKRAILILLTLNVVFFGIYQHPLSAVEAQHNLNQR
jgi:hypothetical protein